MISRFQKFINLVIYDLLLMSSVTDVSTIPIEGKHLIVVAKVNDVLNFRIFDGEGKAVVNTHENRLADRAEQIEDLRKQLAGLWPPHELTGGEKGLVNGAVASIVAHTQLIAKHATASETQMQPNAVPPQGKQQSD